MKLLVEVVSCAKDRWKQKGPRESWIKEWGYLIDYRFLLGEGNLDEQPDEWILPVGDDWHSVFLKNQASHKRALALGYDYVFHISLDCYPVIPRLLIAAEELNGRQYVGAQSGGGNYLGEAGYWVGRELMAAIVAAPSISHTYDDQAIGDIARAAGILYEDDRRYACGDQNGPRFMYEDETIWQREPCLSVHLGRGTGTFDPQWMIDCHRSYINAKG